MTRKQVWRYKCDFCKKANLSAASITKHEVSCTMNPNRVCKVCRMIADNHPIQFHPAPLKQLMNLLPNPVDYIRDDTSNDHDKPDFDKVGEDANKVLPQLRELSGDCPACIMAAIRQRGIPVPCVTEFNFSDEMKDIWNEINNANAMASSHDY